MKTISFVAGTLLLFALLPFPYGYYTFLRLIVFMVGLFLAYKLNKINQNILGIFMAIISILFNPIIPIYLSRETWLPIDFFGALVFFYVGSKISEIKK